MNPRNETTGSDIEVVKLDVDPKDKKPFKLVQLTFDKTKFEIRLNPKYRNATVALSLDLPSVFGKGVKLLKLGSSLNSRWKFKEVK